VYETLMGQSRYRRMFSPYVCVCVRSKAWLATLAAVRARLWSMPYGENKWYQR
jgi:hypothetical protein